MKLKHAKKMTAAEAEAEEENGCTRRKMRLRRE